MANKQQLLDNLFEAMEKKYSAELARDDASSELDRILQLRYVVYTDSDVMYAIANRADAETDYLLAEYEADAAYDAYIKCLRAEKEANRNE